MRSVGNSTSSGSKIGVSSKTIQMQEGQVDLGLQQQNQNRPFLRNQDDGFNRSAGHDDLDDDGPDGDGDGNGPTRNEYSSCSMNVVGDIYYVTPAANSSSPGFWGLQPFLKSSGGVATTAMGFPFTAAQWKELERQAMIYKYMVACRPVPPHLLYSSLPSSYLLGKYDAEAGRCRRTDGKKWRCSRDVAPNHKYCERHLHRGRPRSRKPVELVHHQQGSLCDSSVINNNNDNDDRKNDNATKKSRLDGPSPQFAGSSSSAPLILPPKASTFGHPMGSGPNPFEDSRSSAWNEEQQWQQLLRGNVKSLALHHQFEGVPLNLNSQADFSSKSDMGLLQSPLIDAWSMGLAGSKDNGGKNKSSLGASKGSHGNATDEDKCQIHMGLGLIDSWVASSTSPGGPLAEVLRPSRLTTVSRPELHASGSDLISAQVTKVSSPSRVLRKTFVSLSDSSGSNSPTRQNSRTNSDMPFHWLN